MPTTRKRRTRKTGLSQADRAALQVGAGMNHWTDTERERYRELWQQHSLRLIAEAEENDGPRPLAELEFSVPEAPDNGWGEA